MGRHQSTGTQTSQEVSVNLSSSVTRKVQFADAKEEYEPSSDCSSGDETFSGESCTFGPGQGDLSGETMSKRPRGEMLSVEPTSERSRDIILSRKPRNSISKSEDNNSYFISSSDRSQSEVAIRSLLLERKQRWLNREMPQDPERLVSPR